MKEIHIISGILLFLLIAVSSASAGELDFSNTAGATDMVNVQATYSGNILTIWAEPKNASVTSVRIDEIGFNRASDKVAKTSGGIYDVVDNLVPPVYWSFKGANQNVDDVGSFTSVFKSEGSKATRVITTFIDNGDIDTNVPDGFKVSAHVAWAGTVPGDGTFEGSAFFAGNNTEIPEVPTIAAPVAVILGLLFVIQRRKEN